MEGIIRNKPTIQNSILIPNSVRLPKGLIRIRNESAEGNLVHSTIFLTSDRIII